MKTFPALTIPATCAYFASDDAFGFLLLPSAGIEGGECPGAAASVGDACPTVLLGNALGIDEAGRLYTWGGSSCLG